VDETLAEHRKNPAWRPPSDDTFAAFAQRWLESQHAHVRATTSRSYRQMLAHSTAILGAKPLSHISPLDCQEVASRIVAAGKSPRTAQYALTVLRHALADAVDWGLLPVNPAARVKPPRTPRRELAVPTPDEARALLHAAESHRLYALWAVLATTGMRIAEALALRWADLDDRRRTLTIRRTLSGAGRRKRWDAPKTARGARTVAIDAWLLDVLRPHRQQQRLDRVAACPFWQDSDLIFTTSRGTWWDPRNVHRAFMALLATAGLPTHYRIRDLRHAMATAWLAAAVNPKVVSERLGHASVAFTMLVYGHVLPTA